MKTTYIGSYQIENSRIKNIWAVDAYNELDALTPEEAKTSKWCDDINELVADGSTLDNAYDSVLSNLNDTILGL